MANRVYTSPSVRGPHDELSRGIYALIAPAKFRMLNYTAKPVVIGSVVFVDIVAGSTGATKDLDGSVTDFGRRIVTATTTLCTAGIAGVVVDLLDDGGAETTEVVVQFRGVCSALCYGASGVASGKELKVNNGEGTFDQNGAAGSKTFAYSLSDSTGSATADGLAELVTVLLLVPFGGGI